MREKKNRQRRTGRGEETAGTMPSSSQDFTGDGNFSPKAGSSKPQSHGTQADASPDSKCPICLDRFDNVSHLDRCLHRFCFRCIQEWAKNKAECPLCKQPFHSIFHSVRAEDDFKEYVLRPTLNGSFANPNGHRFRYRTTQIRNHYLSLRSLRSSAQRTFTPPDNGVLFEGFSSLQSQQRESDIHQMMRRLASRRRANAEGRRMRQIQEQELINFRRALYRSGIRVRNIQDGGRYRDISAEFFRRNPACLHRLLPWLKRELTVLFGTHGSLVNIVQHLIMSNVTRYDMESQAFVEDLQPFLLNRTDHFIHEFINFARCPYNIDAYDQHANYDCPAPSYDEGSRSESSVITISPDEVNIRELDVPSSVSVGQAPWDDETPGPSYSNMEAATNSVLTTVSDSEEEHSSNIVTVVTESKDSKRGIQDEAIPSDDCVIVGYVKPLAERTPELVELSSDSEGSLCEVKIENAKKLQPKPVTLIESSDSSRSSTPSTCSSYKPCYKVSHKRNKTNEKFHCKKTEMEKSSRNRHKSKKDKGHSHSIERWRGRSRSSDCFSRSSHNKAHDSQRHHSKKSHKTKTPEKSRRKSWREWRRSRSRDRSLSWQSRTVSLTSGSSKERGRSSSKSRNHRSRSHDSNSDRDSYRSSYQWEYTYYSRNRNRDGYEQSYRKHTRGRGHYSRSSPDPKYRLQSYSERKDSRKHRGSTTRKQNHRDRNQTRSYSNIRINTPSSQLQPDKPSGKRKYKTRHLETQNKPESDREINVASGEEDFMKKDMTTRNVNDCKNDSFDVSLNESKLKLKRARSPSVEIIYEGKAVDGSRHQKKKKKKHKKKRRREHTSRSPAHSPFIITIDSDGGNSVVEDPPRNLNSTVIPGENLDKESNMTVPSQSPTTSVTVDTTEPGSTEGTDTYYNGFDLLSDNGHLDFATRIMDDLHSDDSSNDNAPPAEQSIPELHTLLDEEAVMPELLMTDFNFEQNHAIPATPPVITDSEETLAETMFDCMQNLS